MASKKKSVSFTLTKGDSSVECSVPVGVAPDSFLRAAEASLTKLAAARLDDLEDDEEEDEDEEDDEGEGDDLEACAEEDDAETSPVPTKEDLKFLKTHPDDRLARKLERAVISPTEVSVSSSEEETSEEDEDEVNAGHWQPMPREQPKRASKEEGEAVRTIQARLLSVDPEELAKALSPPPKQLLKHPTSPPAVVRKRGPKQELVPRFDADSVAQARRKKLRDAALAKMRVVDITDSDLEEATSAHEVARRAAIEAASAGAPVLPAKAGKWRERGVGFSGHSYVCLSSPPVSNKKPAQAAQDVEPARAPDSPPIFEY